MQQRPSIPFLCVEFPPVEQTGRGGKTFARALELDLLSRRARVFSILVSFPSSMGQAFLWKELVKDATAVLAYGKRTRTEM